MPNWRHGAYPENRRTLPARGIGHPRRDGYFERQVLRTSGERWLAVCGQEFLVSRFGREHVVLVLEP
jgi:hypothetical protein